MMVMCQLCSALVSAQEEPSLPFNAKTYNPLYRLGFPKGWQVERRGMPIDFAPRIPYKGVEDLRYAPGWSDTASAGHWTYFSLWWIEDEQRFNSSVLEQLLWAYYTGLVGRNIVQRGIPTDKLVKLTTNVKKTKKQPGDEDTYLGDVHMLNYMNLQPIDLHLQIHWRKCTDQKHTVLLIQVSPKTYDDDMWKGLNDMRDSFQCMQ